jgi:hypothetical protein
LLTCRPPLPPQSDKAAIDQEAALLAFDRQNHMGASEQLAKKLRQTISEEAEVMLADKHTAAGAVNIRANAERMKVGVGGCVSGVGGWVGGCMVEDGREARGLAYWTAGTGCLP